MSEPIAPINSITPATSSTSIVERVYSDGKGKHIVDKTIYVVTLYDANGVLTSVTNSHKINYLV
ncbi:MAG: hypothetical protein H8E12_17235 [Rhodobacteraceae bacterium]|nr:hypothetical protein [Paracoccaceae bacterium]